MRKRDFERKTYLWALNFNVSDFYVACLNELITGTLRSLHGLRPILLLPKNIITLAFSMLCVARRERSRRGVRDSQISALAPMTRRPPGPVSERCTSEARRLSLFQRERETKKSATAAALMVQ